MINLEEERIRLSKLVSEKEYELILFDVTIRMIEEGDTSDDNYNRLMIAKIKSILRNSVIRKILE